MATRKKGAKKGAAKPQTQRTGDSLLDQLEGNHPEAFIFSDSNPRLIGKVVRFSRGHSKDYGPHPVVVIQNEADGELRSVHLLHGALRAQMDEANPMIGDRIGIVYRGEAESARGRTYKDYRVRVDTGATSAPVRSYADSVAHIMRDVPAPEPDGDDPDDGDDLPF